MRHETLHPGPQTDVGHARRLATPDHADSCFFRSGPPPGARKLLLQITERCDLHCSHCFVSANRHGEDMALDAIRSAVPTMIRSRVSNVTVTGGEPLLHPELVGILELLDDAGLAVTICTNGVSLDDLMVRELQRFERLSVNVSLDGLSAGGHGRFRGNRQSFDRTVEAARRLAAAGLLKGILSTPNQLATASEYEDLYDFGRGLGVEYVLFNPMSEFGRGTRNQRLRARDATMHEIRSAVDRSNSITRGPEPVWIRFPNEDLPLAGCTAGDIVYVFVNGDVAVCPYLAFAAGNPGSRHHRDEFIVGNLFTDDDFVQRIDSYRFHDRFSVGDNGDCQGCSHETQCGKGCPAAVVAAGGRIGDRDRELCPLPETVPVSLGRRT